ncbi:hypothetical protein N7495_002783 [Penicillium taxi]|uniref:uncharacterized protein n=1 Tax=Penicillium taxi TaxID=168475 RepID=UPI00254540B3|nr:uncharacterized protein N7495_002783 [Penicillium taxi]KAJ5902255.1 hypothetical protein N7495_002783 [Penicillium taxi]
MKFDLELQGDDYILRQRKDVERTPISKRIIICCDGTWQSAVSGKKNIPSNVTRLCRALNRVGTDENGKEWQQVVWYDSGVGTSSNPLSDVIAGAFGNGLETNVIEAYNFCVLNYNPGDEIMCFGFSRGAYTARTIAGLISDVGICYKIDLNRFPDLWAVYKTFPHGDRFHRSDLWFDWLWGKADEHQGAGSEGNRELICEEAPQRDWAQEGSREVKVVGVFDTVGSLGMPEVMGIKLPTTPNNSWHNVGLSDNIKNAFQALALDEHRNAFSPSVWHLSNKTATPEEVQQRRDEEDQAEKDYWSTLQQAKDLKAGGKATDKQVNDAARHVNEAARAWNKASRERVIFQNRLELHPTLKQVWFPGYHIHVGGGSNDTLKNEGDMEEMSNITFHWMLDQVKIYLSLDERYIAGEHHERESNLAAINSAYTKWKTTEQSLETTSWGNKAWKNIKAVASALKHPLSFFNEPAYKALREYGWGTGILNDSFTAIYWLNGQKRRTPGEYAMENGEPLGDTFEFIHPVVNFRYENFKKINRKDHKHILYSPIGPAVKYERWKTTDSNENVSFVYHIGNSPKPIPEWKLGGLDAYERLSIAGTTAYDYVDNLDEELKTGIRTIRRTARDRSELSTEVPVAAVLDTGDNHVAEREEIGTSGVPSPTEAPISGVLDTGDNKTSTASVSSDEEDWGKSSQATEFDGRQSGNFHPETVESKISSTQICRDASHDLISTPIH